MRTMALLLCAVACAKPAPRVLPAPGGPLGFEFRLDALRRTAAARPPERVGRSTIFVKSRTYAPGVDPGEAVLVPGEQVFDCPEVLPGVPVVVRFVEAP